MTRVFREFVEADLHEKIGFVGSGRLGFPEMALLAFAMGCDMVNVGREAMLAIGCIQAQRCHTGFCPTGVATQSRWLMKGLDPNYKAARLANYIVTLRKEVLHLSYACGLPHPALITTDFFEILDECFGSTTASDCFGYPKEFGLPSSDDQCEIQKLMTELRVGS